MLAGLFGRDERSISSVPWQQHPDSGWGVWPGDTAPTWSGSPVNERNAAQLLAVYGSASFITDEISTLPIDVGDAQRPSWVDAPTEGLDRIAWIGQIMWSLLFHGNAYGAVLNGTRGVSAVDILDPDRVRVTREAGRKRFYVNGAPSPVEIIHIPGRVRPGDLIGMSPVEWARQTIGLGMAAARYGAQFFENEGNMPGVIESPGAMQPDTMTNLAQQWRRKRSAGGRGLPGVLQGGATWKPTGVTNEQAQFLATRKFTSAEIIGQMFLLDPSDLGVSVEGSNLTYANLAQRNTRRVQVTLMPWIRRIEAGLSPLIPGGEYRFNVDARLRGDTRESYETLAVALAAGFMTIDEVREILGLPPRPNQAEAPTARELAEMIQKIYLGVDVVLSADEAREILNSGGAALSAGFEPGFKRQPLGGGDE
jgi:HK97 family phage portal protein